VFFLHFFFIALWGCSTREEVERFDPDRWNNAENAEIRRYTYLPFGAGSRMCVGMKLANLEMKVVLTEILRRYVVAPDPKRPLELYTDSTLQPKGAWIILTPRK
jgi:cytochrome P450